MKKLLAISLLLLALVLTVVACQNDTPPADTTVAETTAAEEPTAAPTDPVDTTAPEDPTAAPDTTAAPETTAEPETTEKPEVTTEKPEEPTEPPETEPVDLMAPVNVFDADALNTNTNSGNGVASVERIENFVRITPKTSDPNYYPFSSVDGGRYVAIKYRTDNAAGTAVQFYIASIGTAPSDDTSMLRQSTIADGEWHVAVFDTMPLIDAGIYDGSYVSYFRFDPLECDYVLDADGNTQRDETNTFIRYPMPEGATIDVAYVAFFNAPEAAELYEYAPAYIATPEQLAAKAANATTATLNDGFVTLTGDGADGWISALDAGSVADLNAFVIALRYRTTASESGEFFAGSGAGATPGSEQFFSYITDGDWHTLLADVSALSDMSGALNYIRYDYFADCTGKSIDIAYIAVFDTAEKAEKYDDFINRVPDDTHRFRTDIAFNFRESDDPVDLKNTDLTPLFDIRYGLEEAQYAAKNAGAPYYGMTNFSSMAAKTDGAYAYTVNVVSTAGPAGFATVFVRGVENASMEKQYFGQDGHDDGGVSMGGAGIYLNVVDKGEDGLLLRINLKTYDGGYVPNITYVPIRSSAVTVADNGRLVSIIAGDELVATVRITGTKDYALDAVGAEELAATAVLTLADGTETVYENACVAASHISQVGVATRTGTIVFNSLSLLPYSSCSIPSFPAVDVPALTTDKTAYTVGEPIMVTAIGAGDQWVGLYRPTGTPGTDLSSMYYYYVDRNGHNSGDTVCLNDPSCNPNTERYTDKLDLPVGEYRVMLFADGGYTVAETITITVVDPNAALTTDKDTYHVGEAITVTATTYGKYDWVGIFPVGDDKGYKTYYYPNQSYPTPSDPAPNGMPVTLQFAEPLAPGQYNVYLLSGNLYPSDNAVIKHVQITVVE